MAERSTLLKRLETEMSDLDSRIRVTEEKKARLESEKSALADVIKRLRASIKKSSASVSEMPRKSSAHPATA